MVSPLRYLLPLFLLVGGLHTLFTMHRNGSPKSLSLTSIRSHFSSSSDLSSISLDDLQKELSLRLSNDSYRSLLPPEPTPRKANATILMLARNSELTSVMSSVKQLEDRFNRQHHYPWVFLNDEPFTEEFIEHVSALTSAETYFGVIPRDHWRQPDWIDEAKALQGRRNLVKQHIIYGGSISYRNMCRFNSGFFYRHELLKSFRYYWRVEPGVQFFCDVDYDPFVMFEDEGKVYGFTISLREWEPTIASLWSTVKEFTAKHPEYVAANNSMDFISDDGGNTYNLCHFWSNFEIADQEFWRGEAYSAFFDYLESKGGFYYERWGDAPVHSIAAALFAPRDKIHVFKDIGYRHDPFQHCPQGNLHTKGRCWCNPDDNFDYRQGSCMQRWEDLMEETVDQKPLELDVGSLTS